MEDENIFQKSARVFQNLPYKFKKDFQNRNFEKSHIRILAWMLVELLVHGRIWDRIRDPEQILV